MITDAEAVVSNRVLMADPARRDLLGPRVRASLAEAQAGLPRIHQPRESGGFPGIGAAGADRQPLPASLQLVGGPNAEALLLATGAMIEAAV